MTREEQIRQAGIEYTIGTRPICIGGDAFSELIDEINRCPSFEEGAKWADEHPVLTEEEQVGMSGLGMEWQKQALIKKACKYLQDNIDKDLVIYCNDTWKSRDEFIVNLIKAMEE